MTDHASATSPSAQYDALTIPHEEPVSPDSCLLVTAWDKVDGESSPNLSDLALTDHPALIMRPSSNAGEGGAKALTRSALNAPGEVPASLRKTS